MDIHKPKPIRNWREFLKEYAIVVLGVLTALLLEQAVENWREHRQYLEARQAMRAELANSFDFMARRTLVSSCAATRMAEIEALLDKAERHQPFTPPSWIGSASSARLSFTAEAEAGRSGLFPVAEQRQFSLIYSYLHSIDAEQDRERQAWAQLRGLEGRASLTPETIAHLREALSQARFANARIPFLWSLADGYARPLALPNTRIVDQFMPETWPHCLPMDTPPAEGARRTAYRNLDKLSATLNEGAQ